MGQCALTGREADPAVVDPDPAVVDPDPAVVDPDPAVVDLDPAGVDLDPAVVDLDPAGVDLYPAVVDLDPAVVDPDPVFKKNRIRILFITKVVTMYDYIKTLCTFKKIFTIKYGKRKIRFFIKSDPDSFFWFLGCSDFFGESEITFQRNRNNNN